MNVPRPGPKLMSAPASTAAFLQHITITLRCVGKAGQPEGGGVGGGRRRDDDDDDGDDDDAQEEPGYPSEQIEQVIEKNIQLSDLAHLGFNIDDDIPPFAVSTNISICLLSLPSAKLNNFEPSVMLPDNTLKFVDKGSK